MTIDVALDAHATIGESATWVAAERALYWIDVKAPALHRYHPDDGTSRSWPLSSDVGGFALTDDGGAVVALRYGIHRLDLDSGALHLLAPPPFDPRLFRFNEAICDAAGRLWIGVMFDPIEGSPPKARAALHSFTTEQGLLAAPDTSDLHNGMAWSADGTTFYLSHSNSGEIFAYDYDVAVGALSKRRLFATVPSHDGIPDGAAVDSDGGYWSALHGGSKLRRFKPDGSPDRDVALPVSQPTMPVFAGVGLATLYLTTASDKLSAGDRKREPSAGALLELDVAARGIFRPYLVR